MYFYFLKYFLSVFTVENIIFFVFAATLPPRCVKRPVYRENRVVADRLQVAASGAILLFFESQSTQNHTLFRVFGG